MDHAEIETIKTMQRSAADRAEVLSRAVRQNMKHGEFDMVTIAMQEVASAAWGVAGGMAEPAELLDAAERALELLDTQTHCMMERVMLREAIEQAQMECQDAIPDDAFVTGPHCLAAHMADLETEPEL